MEWSSGQSKTHHVATLPPSSPSLSLYERLMKLEGRKENDSLSLEGSNLATKWKQLEDSTLEFFERWSTRTGVARVSLSSTHSSSVTHQVPSSTPSLSSIPSAAPARTPGNRPKPKHSGFLSQHLEEDVQQHAWWIERGVNYTDFLPWPTLSEMGFMFAIVNNELYVEVTDPNYYRGAHNLWGMLELLERYPGQVKDTMGAVRLHDSNGNADDTRPFHLSQACQYAGRCATTHNGLLLPDWTFWGNWMYNKTDWERELPELQAERRRIPWKDREPKVYWRGAAVSVQRRKALECSEKAPYNETLAIRVTTWSDKMKAEAPTFRYALHLPGENMWSVARKYQWAVGSTVIDPNIPAAAFWDRDVPRDLFLPIPGFWENRARSWGPNNDTLCELLVAAQRWGEEHQEEAERMSRAVGEWIDEHLTMEHVYEYMLDLFDIWNKKVWRGPVVITPWMRKISRKTFLQVLPCVPKPMHVFFTTHFPITGPLAKPFDDDCRLLSYYDLQRNVWCGVNGTGCLNPNPGT